MKPPFEIIISNEIEQWRWDTFWTKEPETIEWIKSFKDGDIFFDVGANIGVYSLYCAAIHRNCKIAAFEPSRVNFQRLCQNIVLNKFYNIFPFPTAIANYAKTEEVFGESELNYGSSGGQIEDLSEKCQKVSFVNVNTLSTISKITGLSPHYVKIDVDGQEWKVLHGMDSLLKGEILKSVLIEINNQSQEIHETFYFNGFNFDNHFNQLDNHSRIRRKKEGIKAENVIFTRR